MPKDLVVLIVAQTFVAAVFHWAPRWGGGRFFFSVTVDEAFTHSDEGRAILATYRVRVWTHWIASCALVAALHRWGPHVAPIGLLWLPLGAEVAFGAAQRRVRPHGAPPSSLRTADLSPRPPLPGGRLAQSGPFLMLAAVAYAVWRSRASIDALQALRTPSFRPPPFGGAVAFVMGAAVCCGLLWALATGLRTRARHPSAASRRSTLLSLLATEYLLAAMTAAIFLPVSVARSARDLRLLPFALLGLVLAFLVVIGRLTTMGPRTRRVSIRGVKTAGSGASSTGTPTTRRSSCRSGWASATPSTSAGRAPGSSWRPCFSSACWDRSSCPLCSRAEATRSGTSDHARWHYRTQATFRSRMTSHPTDRTDDLFQERPMNLLSGIGADLRHGLRQLAHSPGFTAVAVLSLALGIGANTAVFSLVDDVLLRSLPVRHPERLVLLRNVQGPSGRMSRAGENNGSTDPVTGRASSTSFSVAAFEAFRAHPAGLSHVFAFAPFNQVHLLVDGVPETEVLGQLVSGSYHAGLGVSAIVGRPLTEDDDRLAATPVAVISWRYWQRRFGGDPSVVGKTVQVNRVPTVIVGVTPRGFSGAMQVGESADISVPLALHARFQPDRGANRAQPWYWWIRVMGRLAPAATPSEVRAALEPILQGTAREGWRVSESLAVAAGAGPMPEPPTLAADPGGQGENDSRRQYRSSLGVLMGLVGLVLLAACANVATLMMARGAARRPEIAVRLALGASRGRIVRQLLAESLVLSGLATALGTALAFWGRGLLVALRQFSGSTVVLDLPIDARVLAFTIAVSVGTAILFGLGPALRASRVDLAPEFQGGARSVGRRSRSMGSRSLVVVQVAVSLVLLVGTGLFIRTLRNLQDVDPGFNPRALALFRIQAHTAGYGPAQFAALHARIQERLAALPGVRVATFSNVPLLTGRRSGRRLSVAGGAPVADAPASFNINGVAPNFFEAMEIPLLLGRPFTAGDATGAPRVAIVNEAFTREVFGQENPIGRHLKFGMTPLGGGEDVEIVGVARDAKYTGLRDPAPGTVYLSAAQQMDGEANYCVRAAGNPAALFGAIRSAVREVDPTLAVTNVRTQEDQIARISAQERLFARVSGFFGVVALALAGVGLYGLTSYMVVRRTGEFGVRMALGALPRQVLSLVLRESLVLVAAGIVLGLVAAYGASGAVASLLFGLSPVDSVTYAVVPLILLAVALLASLVPARRATRVDPVAALRAE